MRGSAVFWSSLYNEVPYNLTFRYAMEQEIPANRMTARYIKKRAEILHAAAQLFNQHGIKGATLFDVASRVGLSTNSVTYYYKKKEELVVACMLLSIGAINDTLAVAMKCTSPEERIRQFIRLHFVRLAQTQRGKGPELMRLREVQLLGSPHAEVIFTAYREMFRSVRRLFMENGVRVPNWAALNARAFLLMVQAVGAMVWAQDYDPDDHERIAARMCDVLIGGIAAPGAAWCTVELDATLTQAPDTVETPQDAFLRAATALINEKDYRGASVDQISARLNVTKGSFYHYNLNKDDLIVACFDRTLSVVQQIQVATLQGSGSGWDKLCALSRALVLYHLSERGPLLRATAWSELPKDIRASRQKDMERLGGRFSIFLVDGMIDGSIRPLDQAIAARLVRVMIDAAAIIDHWLPDANTDNAVDLLVRPLFLGILSP
jgi:AcrR family transcriptional regulator